MIDSKVGRVAIALAVLVLVGGSACATREEDEAVAAAREWLELLDAGQFVEAWERSSSTMRERISQETFVKAVRGARVAIGRVVARRLKSAQAARTLPGAPRGKYVVVLFESVFENTPHEIETVSQTHEDGVWRAIGYKSQ